MAFGLELTNGNNPDTGKLGKGLLRPIEETASRSALRWSDQGTDSHEFDQVCRKTLDLSKMIIITTSIVFRQMEFVMRPGRYDRRNFIGGSDARVIMGSDEDNLVRLWREKRGEIEPEDLSANLIVQLGTVTEDLNRHWYERSTGHVIKDAQRHVKHPVLKWMAATLDGLVDPGGAVFEAKFMLPWTFSEEAAAEKHMAQLQHNMWVTNARSSVLSIITGGGKWVELTIHADPLYQHLLLTAERKFWRCVQNGETPRLFGVEPPKPRLDAVRIVDMSASNSWADFASTFRRTRTAHQEHESAKGDLKKLMPEDAKEATGHGLRAKRSKSGAISFELAEVADASIQ